MPVDPQVFRLLRDDPQAFVPWLAHQALSPRTKPLVRQAFLAATAPASPADAAADFEIVRAADFSARLTSIACPLTWIDGADDQIVPTAAREGRPGAVVTVPDAGHLLPIEAPAAIAATVIDVLGR